MSTPEIFVGIDAVRRLTVHHPDAHVFFGYHESAEAFALALTRPGWLVYESEACWVITEDKGLGIREVHWFCPEGAKLPALRRILRFIFETTGALTLCGVTPKGHPSERYARVVNRAVGAECSEGVYVLQRDRFLAYNRPNVNPEDGP